MIEIVGVTKAYGGAVVLDDVSLALPREALTAIVGPNGAGKSTLLSLVARLVPMTAGRIHVDGLDVSATPGAVLARKLAILRQDNHITPRLTVRELVAFGRYPHSKGRLTPRDMSKVAAAISYVELDGQNHRFLDELSGGQRQRAFVAMVLAQDSDCLLLDEPLNNLDIRHAAAMMKLLRRAVDELGKTVVIVIHDVNFASCYADVVVALKEGRVAFRGSPGELMNGETLRRIYDMDIGVYEHQGRRLAMFYH